jgi:nucleotide-binding universal stress UspA family protein
MIAMNSQQPQTSTGRIVVGVDSSPSSQAALAFGVRQAGLTGATVEAVIAWHYPVMVAGYGSVPASDETDWAAIASRTLSDAIARTVDPGGTVKVSTTVQKGSAAEVLLAAAGGADLLVVGSRGHGGFSGALLGSVSQHCAHHSPCPIVIIREAGQD